MFLHNISSKRKFFLAWTDVIFVSISLATFLSYHFYYRYYAFSQEWLMLLPGERKEIIDFEIIYKALKGKGKEEVVRFLGNPEEKASDHFYYALGYQGGARWVLSIVFDKDCRVSQVLPARLHHPDALKMVAEWLTKKVDTWNNGQACKSFDKLGPTTRVPAIVFLGIPDKNPWNWFTSEKISGDELWYYESPKETWLVLDGEAGYALVRNQKVIEYFITTLN